MAYEKQNWKCGDIVSAEKLNHMEDGIEEALECCESGGDIGYECTETITTLTEESVTTVQDGNTAYGDLAYTEQVTADAITVTFNSVEYECSATDAGWGAPWNDSTESFDWSEYPFHMWLDGNGNQLITETAGTYSLKIEVLDSSVTTTPCFRKAVESALPKTALFVTGYYFSGVYSEFSHSVQEIFDTIANHGIVMVSITNSGYSNSHPVYVPYLIETVNGDTGIFGDITKVYFQDVLDDSHKVSATIINGSDVWATVS